MLTGDDVLGERIDDWRLLQKALHARFRTGDFVTGLALVNRIGAAAEAANHHPDLDLRYPYLDIRLISHDAGGVTERDIALARQISEYAAEAGVAAEPGAVMLLELAVDTANHEAIEPFWRAVYGLDPQPSPGKDVVDPAGVLPALWFQPTEAHETPKQRFHLDVHVPHDQAEARVAAVLAAGGTLVLDTWAPNFWVLADADGNKACICTWQPPKSSEV